MHSILNVLYHFYEKKIIYVVKFSILKYDIVQFYSYIKVHNYVLLGIVYWQISNVMYKHYFICQINSLMPNFHVVVNREQTDNYCANY